LFLRYDTDMPITKTMRAFVLDRDKRCLLCGASAEQEQLEVDHWLPKALGGEDKLENLRTLCLSCNRGKGKALFTKYTSLISNGLVPSPPTRPTIQPNKEYQLTALTQIVDHLERSGITILTIPQFIGTFNQSLRDGINPIFEPLSYPLLIEGMDELVANGRLVFDNNNVSIIAN
jgi:hypothetical protein